MPQYVDPRFFQFGNAFAGGMQQAQEQGRRDEMLNLEQQQQQMYQRRMMQEQQRFAQQQQASQQEQQQIAAAFREVGLPEEWAGFPEGREIFSELMKQKVAPAGKASESAAEAEFRLAKESGFRGSYLDFVREKGKAGRSEAGPAASFQFMPLADGTIAAGNTRTGQITPTSQKGPNKNIPQVDPAASQANKAQDAQNVVLAIDDAEKNVGFFTTGLLGQVMGNLGGTDAYDLRASIDTIKANVGFDRLQRMREESKTGGALGNVAIQELNMLQAVIASLDPNQSEPQLRRKLRQVRSQYTKAINAYNAAKGQAPGGAPAGQGWSIRPREAG